MHLSFYCVTVDGMIFYCDIKAEVKWLFNHAKYTISVKEVDKNGQHTINIDQTEFSTW